ncbi:hypothetical protein GCM10025777_06440 [Membranihabitans marinus]
MGTNLDFMLGCQCNTSFNGQGVSSMKSAGNIATADEGHHLDVIAYFKVTIAFTEVTIDVNFSLEHGLVVSE